MNKIIAEDLDFILENDLDWEKFRGKTVLITGAYGMLLSYMSYALLWLNQKKNMDVTVIVLARSLDKAKKKLADFANSQNLKFLVHDLSSPLEVADGIDYIIHGAGYGDPKNFGVNPQGVIIPNTLGTFHLLELARAKSVKGFLFFSSGAVYGTPQSGEKVTETYQGTMDPLDAKNSYGESKRMGENMCRAWFEQFAVPTKIVRPTHIYGPTMDIENDSRVVASFVRKAVHGENIVMKSDGSAKRPFCYLADATTGFFKVLLEGANGEAYNVGDDSSIISIWELAEIVCASSHKPLQVVTDTAGSGGKQYQMFMLSKKLEALGWKPSFSIREGVRRTVQSFSEK